MTQYLHDLTDKWHTCPRSMPSLNAPDRSNLYTSSTRRSPCPSYTNAQSTISNFHGFSMDTLDLEPPIATLRSLGALSKDGVSTEPPSLETEHRLKPMGVQRANSCDPISNGILSSEDAQKAINM